MEWSGVGWFGKLMLDLKRTNEAGSGKTDHPLSSGHGGALDQVGSGLVHHGELARSVVWFCLLLI